MRYLYKYTLVASILVFSLFCLVTKLKITSEILEIILYSAIAILCYIIFFKVILRYRQLVKLKKCMKKRFSYVLVQCSVSTPRNRILNIYMFNQGNTFDVINERRIDIPNTLIRVGRIEIRDINLRYPEHHLNTVSYHLSPSITPSYHIIIYENGGLQNIFKANKRVFCEDIEKSHSFILSIDDMYTFFANNVLLIGTPKDVWLKLVRYLRNIEIYIKSCQKNAYLDINDKDILSTEIRHKLKPILRDKRIKGYI